MTTNIPVSVEQRHKDAADHLLRALQHDWNMRLTAEAFARFEVTLARPSVDQMEVATQLLTLVETHEGRPGRRMCFSGAPDGSDIWVDYIEVPTQLARNIVAALNPGKSSAEDVAVSAGVKGAKERALLLAATQHIALFVADYDDDRRDEHLMHDHIARFRALLYATPIAAQTDAPAEVGMKEEIEKWSTNQNGTIPAAGTNELPRMLTAFRTTVSRGGESPTYEMVFRFGALADLHAADDEWHAYRAALRASPSPAEDVAVSSERKDDLFIKGWFDDECKRRSEPTPIAAQTDAPPVDGEVREQIARIIDPDEWALHDFGMAKTPPVAALFIGKSLTIADQILDAIGAATPSSPRGEG